MNTLLLYFILVSFTIAPDGSRTNDWEFYALEHINGGDVGRDYCEQLALDVAGTYEGKIGNMKVFCVEDMEEEL